MDNFLGSLLAGVVSGSVISTLLGVFLHRRAKSIEAEIKSQYDRSLAIFQSTRSWKERAVSELLGPIFIQFDRTERAFDRWQSKNLFLEAKVIMEGNLAIRDVLLMKSHLIPPALREDAGKLVEHYDRWLEEFQKIRSGEKPDLDTPFIFVGPQGYPFPKASEVRFKQAFNEMWAELYSPTSDGSSAHGPLTTHSTGAD
jgi:hypothetical protein